MTKKRDTTSRHTTQPGGNVFADLGFKPEEAAKLKIKAQLMTELSEWIKSQNLKQIEAAEILAVTRPRISDLVRGKIQKFTIDALVDMIERTGRHVKLDVA